MLLLDNLEWQTGAKLVQERDFPAPSSHADSACQAVAVTAREGQRDNFGLGICLTSLGLVEVAAVLLPPAPSVLLAWFFSSK